MAAKRSAKRSKTARRPTPARPEAAVPQRTAAGSSDTAADCGTPGPIVVGIGASAGGLEAFRTFLDAMPPDNGLAFVFIPHLDPTRESHMVELLASHTAMTVVQAKDGMPIEADHVYVIPPDEYITISDEVLHLTAPSERRGRRIPIDFFFHSLAEDRHEKAIGIILSDVTSLKRMEEELLKSRVRAIVDTAVDGIITINEEGTIESFNPAAERVFGYAAAEVVGQDVTMLMPSPYRNEHDAYLNRYLQTGEKRIIGIGREVRGRRKDGSTFPMDLAVSEFHDGNGRKFAGIARDITERKRLEREVLEIAAGERHRIIQELHDTTCQELAGLGLLAQGLANQVAVESPAEGGVATKIANGIGRALDQLRAILKGLWPVEVDASGLMAALDELAAQTEALTGITCRFDCAEPITLRDNTMATHLYHIAKEAVTNAVKHGSPTHIGITLDRDGDFVALGVRDNGRGFSEPLDECQGMGLRIMQYRAGLIGATLSIGRVEGGGTVVACRFSEDGHHG